MVTAAGKHRSNGFTLIEILITMLMMSLVFFAAISVFASALRFLRSSQGKDITTIPAITLDGIAKRISLANLVQTNPVITTQYDVRADYVPCSNYTPRNTPNDPTDDGWWHYKLDNGAVRSSCSGNVTPTSPIEIPNATAFSITLVNPSGAGNATVANISVTTSTPAGTLATRAAIGARAKR